MIKKTISVLILILITVNLFAIEKAQKQNRLTSNNIEILKDTTDSNVEENTVKKEKYVYKYWTKIKDNLKPKKNPKVDELTIFEGLGNIILGIYFISFFSVVSLNCIWLASFFVILFGVTTIYSGILLFKKGLIFWLNY